MNKHQELVIIALEEMVENNRWHSAIKRYREMRPQELKERFGGPDTLTGVEMLALLEKGVADVEAAIEWVKAQDA